MISPQSIHVTFDKADLYRKQKLLHAEHSIIGSGYRKYQQVIVM